MTTLLLAEAAARRGLADTRQAAELLTTARDRATMRVDGLRQRWRGAAADSFAAAFEEWGEAAEACLASLDALAGGLALTQDALLALDIGEGARGDHLRGRLG